MNAELAVPNTDLTTAPGQTFFSDKQIAALRQLGVEGASNGDLAVFFHVAARTGLDPFARQIYMISRKDKKRGIVQTIQTAIDGYRLIARRAADKHGETLEYEDRLWCGEDGVWHDVWLSKTHPSAAKVVVLRNGRRYPAIAHWNEYVQNVYEGGPNQFWATKPAGQIAKCAEALALRMAFPMELSGVYTDDEMGHDAPVRRPPATQRVTAAEIVGEQAPAAPVTVPKMTAKQRGQIFGLLAQLGHGDKSDEERAARLQFIGDILGIDVETTSDLDDEQAAVLIEVLHQKVEATDA